MKQPVNSYKYMLRDKFGLIEVFPLGENDFKITYERETEGKYFYTKDFSGKITFTGETFKRLKKIESSTYICTLQKIQVYKICGDSEILLFEGDIKLTEAEWDIDNCKVIIKFEKEKQDKCLYQNKSKKVNLFKYIGNRVDVKTNTAGGVYEYKTCRFQKYVKDTDERGTEVWCSNYMTGVTFDTSEAYLNKWVIVSNTIDMNGALGPSGQGGNLTVTTIWAREIITSSCSEEVPDDWLLISDNCSTLGSKTYAKIPNTYKCEYEYSEFTSTWNFKSKYTCQVLGDVTNSSIIDNGMLLKDVIQTYLNIFCQGLTVVSDFFQINPQNPTNINYVTKTYSQVDNLILLQKSDVKRPNVVNNATKAELTFEKLMETLMFMFNVYYYVEGNTFRIEHISWFTRENGLNLTLDKYKKYVKDLNSYTYDLDEIPNKEHWVYKEQSVNVGWDTSIDYTTSCNVGKSDKEEETYLVDEITTDVELCLTNPDSQSKVVQDTGFVLLATKFFGGQYYIITEGAHLNDSLSFPKLVQHYHFHNRPVNKGIFENKEVTFLSTKPIKRGEELKIPLGCGENFDPNDIIKTNIGNGIVDKATYDLKTCMLNLGLVYDAFSNLYENKPPRIVGDLFIETYKNMPKIKKVEIYDPDGIYYGLFIVEQAKHGFVEITNQLELTYTPNPDFVGSDSFRIMAEDDWTDASQIVTFSVKVYDTNTPPIARPDNYNVYQGYPFTNDISIFANDSDDLGFTLVTPSVITNQGVNVSINSAGFFNYAPPINFVGDDYFDYTIQDNLGEQSTARVTLKVAIKNIPIAVPDEFNTISNVPLITDGTTGKRSLILNDYTPDGLPYQLFCTAESKYTLYGGYVTIQQTGLIAYYPPNNFIGVDSFNYTINNINGSNTGKVTINVLQPIYVKLEIASSRRESTSILCGTTTLLCGVNTYQNYVLKFYKDALGTIPYDVTGLNFRVNISELTQQLDGLTDTFVWTSQILNGTSFNILTDYCSRESICNCDSRRESIFRTISLAEGPYFIIR